MENLENTNNRIDEGNIRVTTRETLPFTMIPNVIIRTKFSKFAKLTWIVLSSYAYGDTLESYPSIETIMWQVDCGRNTVINALKELEEKGLIKIKKEPGFTSHYEIVSVKQLDEAGKFEVDHKKRQTEYKKLAEGTLEELKAKREQERLQGIQREVDERVAEIEGVQDNEITRLKEQVTQLMIENEGLRNQINNSAVTEQREEQPTESMIHEEPSPQNPFDKLPQEAKDLTLRLIDRIRENFPRQPVPSKDLVKSNTKLLNWVKEMDRLHRIGVQGGEQGFKWSEISEILEWCQNNDFWRRNILSVEKLRKQAVRLQNECHSEFNRRGFNGQNGNTNSQQNTGTQRISQQERAREREREEFTGTVNPEVHEALNEGIDF